MYLVIGLIYYGNKFSVAVVSEKETKVRDGMRMMGCSSFVMYSSWMFTTVLSQLPVIVIYTIALSVAKIIYQSNGFLLFITMFLFILSQTAQYVLSFPQCFFVTSCACTS
jgi:ATP-binding cassette subfamily A (ABC1) protein 5